jgi:hypothetical protein
MLTYDQSFNGGQRYCYFEILKLGNFGIATSGILATALQAVTNETASIQEDFEISKFQNFKIALAGDLQL